MRRSSLLVLLAYAAVSFLYFGIHLASHPGRLVVGAEGLSDSHIFIWSLGWWQHALLHGENPFYSRDIFAPTGVNLAQVTSVPALGVAFSPITLLFGPTVAFNVASIVLPALSAFAAYLLCRYVTGSLYASVVGGYLYGFSSFILAHEQVGHLNHIAAFATPLVALTVLRHLRGDLGARALVVRLGLLVALEAYISTENAITMTFMLAVGVALGALLVPEARARIRSALRPILVAYALAGVLALPLVYYAVTGFNNATVFSSVFKIDLLNLVVPTRVIAWGGDTLASLDGRLTGAPSERTLYLGVPILLMMALLVWRDRSRWTRFLLAGFLLATFFSFGDGLYVAGHRVVELPWSLVENRKGFDDIITARFSLYAQLAAVVMVARWIATAKGRVFAHPYVLPALAIASIVPPVWKADLNVMHPRRIEFFSHHLYETCIPKNETVLIFPFGHWGDSTFWQAESGFWFKQAEGTLGHLNQPTSFLADPTNFKLTYYTEAPDRPQMSEVLKLAKRHKIDRVLVVDGENWPDYHDLQTFGTPQLLGGVFVSPACGYRSLTGDTRPPPTS